MANNLGMNVIAEGVETQSQRDYLEKMGACFIRDICLVSRFLSKSLRCCWVNANNGVRIRLKKP